MRTNVRVTASNFTKTRTVSGSVLYRADLTWYRNGKRFIGSKQDFLREEKDACKTD